MHFRLFLLRHVEFFAATGFWTLRILFPRPLAAHMTLYRRAAVEQLARPLRLSESEELGVRFRQRQTAATPTLVGPGEVPLLTAEAIRTPAFRALYRRWLDVGDPALWQACSPVLKDALERNEARIECGVLPHPYGHFTELAGIV